MLCLILFAAWAELRCSETQVVWSKSDLKLDETFIVYKHRPIFATTIFDPLSVFVLALVHHNLEVFIKSDQLLFMLLLRGALLWCQLLHSSPTRLCLVLAVCLFLLREWIAVFLCDLVLAFCVSPTHHLLLGLLRVSKYCFGWNYYFAQQCFSRARPLRVHLKRLTAVFAWVKWRFDFLRIFTPDCFLLRLISVSQLTYSHHSAGRRLPFWALSSVWMVRRGSITWCKHCQLLVSHYLLFSVQLKTNVDFRWLVTSLVRPSLLLWLLFVLVRWRDVSLRKISELRVITEGCRFCLAE